MFLLDAHDFGIDDFVGSTIEPRENEDKHFDPEGVLEVEQELDFED